MITLRWHWAYNISHIVAQLCTKSEKSMDRFIRVFGRSRDVVIGMVHVRALPGMPTDDPNDIMFPILFTLYSMLWT